MRHRTWATLIAALAAVLACAGCRGKSGATGGSGSGGGARPAPTPAYRLTQLTAQPVEPAVEQTVSYKDAVSIIVPAGAVKQRDELRISSIDNPPPPNAATARQVAVYDVSFAKTAQLDKPVAIEFPLDPAWEKPGTFTWISHWDPGQRIWVALSTEIDRKKKVIRARSDHLCPVSVCSAQDYADYQNKQLKPADAGKWYYANDYFVMIYKQSEVEAATCDSKSKRGFRAHIDPTVPVIRADLPAYPENIWHYVNTFRAKYCDAAPKGAGFRDLVKFVKSDWFDTSGTMVHVAGNCSSGRSRISGDLTVTLDKTGYPGLRAEVAHELFHCIQGRYYTAPGMAARKWWMEATAEYASEKVAEASTNFMGGDKINPRFLEAPLTYASSVIYDKAQGISESVAEGVGMKKDAILAEDPHGYHEYTAAFFIDFLVTRKKIDFKEMFETVAASYNPSVASPLDAYLKTKGTSLDDCYSEFARWWVFDPKSPLHTRKLVKNLDDIGEASAAGVMEAKQGMLARSLWLAADRTAKLWSFTVEPDKKTGKPRDIAVAVRAAPKDGKDDLKATGWIGYVYVVRKGEPPQVEPSPVATLDPGPTGEFARCEPFAVKPDEQVGVLLVNLNPLIGMNMSMEASVEFPYRSCDVLFLVQGPAQMARSDSKEAEGNWKKTGTASLGNVALDRAPVFMQGNDFTLYGNVRDMALQKDAKVQLKGRFDKDRRVIEELSVRWDLDGAMANGTWTRQEHWTFRAKGVPRSESAFRDRHEFDVEYDLDSTAEEQRAVPRGFAVLEATYNFKESITSTYQEKDDGPVLTRTQVETHDNLGKPARVHIDLTFRGDPPKAPPPKDRQP